MRLNKHVLMGVTTGAYTLLFITTFDAWHDSVLITAVALTGLSGWLYGIRIGIFSILPLIFLNTAILFLVSGTPEDILLTYNPTGIGFSMIFTLSTGFMHTSQKNLEKLRISLSDRVNETTYELDQLIQYAIKQDEKERIETGQDLHDGVGQYLTGMLLHCESLCQSLIKAQRTEAALAERMTQRIKNSIMVIRQLSRAQLPLRTAETTLESALEELTTYFTEVSTANFHLEHIGDRSRLSPETAQHLYRISHETIHRALYKYRAESIYIRFITRTSGCVIIIEATQLTAKAPPASELISKIMEYRARTIGGTFTLVSSPKGGFQLECSTLFEGAKK